MGVDALAALLFGYLYDKKGIFALKLSVFLTLPLTPIFFLVNQTYAIIIGVIIWGIAMGAQESILKAVISNLVSKEKRATAYGIFYTVFGSAWFIGSMIVGLLYQINLLYIVLFSSTMSGVALLFLFLYSKISGRKKSIELGV
jgi:predicted MFS family arabinose efflux permease